MSRIDAYLDAVFEAFAAAGDIAPWPIHIANIFRYFDDLEAEDLYTRLRQVAPKGPTRVAEMFINPSVAKALTMDLVPGLKAAGLGPDERVWFLETEFDALATVQHGDLFCRDGRYGRLSDAEARAASDAAVWISREEDPAALAAAYRLSASAQALVWSLFFYGWTDVAFEVHGPYHQDGDGGGDDVVFRDFNDLRPTDVWPGMSALPFVGIRIQARMDPAAESRIDIFNHLTHRGTLHERTQAVAVSIDGHPVTDSTRILEACRALTDAILAQQERVKALDRRELIYKFIETRYYAFRKWRTPFGQDWRPPAEVARRLETWEMIEIPLEGGPSYDVLRRAYDPRDPFEFG